MTFVFDLIILILGLCIGSFLNVIILRLEHGEGVGGRSYCPHCKHQLAWLDLVPVASFVWLGGKCRYCGEKISWQYPIVEISTALIFLLIFNFLPAQAGQFSIFNTVLLFYVASSLIIIFVYDLRHYIIPDRVLFPAIAVAFLFSLNTFVSSLLAAVVASGFFLIIFLISRGRWMGFGDVKLAILMGLLLGFPNIIVALFLAFWLGAAAGLALMIFSKKGLKSQMPFAPFLIAGTFLALFWGPQIVTWYTGLFFL